MKENAKWPLDGCRNVTFNPRATKRKLDALKTKKNNIQAIKLNIFNEFLKKGNF